MRRAKRNLTPDATRGSSSGAGANTQTDSATHDVAPPIDLVSVTVGPVGDASVGLCGGQMVLTVQNPGRVLAELSAWCGNDERRYTLVIEHDELKLERRP